MKLTDREKQDLRKALRPLYGPQVDRWRMNERMLVLYGKLLSDSERCSEALDFVPRPYSGFGAKQYIRRELRRIARAIVNDKRDLYVTCLKNSALKWRREFDLASHGL